MHHKDHPGASEVTTLMSLREAAIYLGVTDETIRRWVIAKKVPALRVGVGRHYRVKREDLDKMVTDAA